MLASLLFLPLLAPSSLRPQEDAADADVRQSLLIHAERVLVGPGEALEGASILVQDGRIVAVGPGLTAPEGTTEVSGSVVCAGLIDAWSTLGLEPAARAEGRTSPASRSADGVDPWAPPATFVEALRGGVTSARVQAGVRAPFGGVGTLLRTSPEPGTAAPLLQEACVGATLGLTRGGDATDIFDRVSEVERLVGAIEKGEAYGRERIAYREELAEWEKAIAEKTEELEKDFKKAKKKRDKEIEEAEEKGKEFKEERYKEDRKPRAPKYDADDEVMYRVADGELPLVVEVHRSEELRNLLAATEHFSRLRLVIAGGTEALDHADELRRRRIPVIVWATPMDAGRPDEYDEHSLALAGGLDAAGVRVLLGSGGSSEPRDLRLMAALAVGHGLDRDAALEAVTRGPAQVFDVGRRIGAVRAGMEADLVVLDGDPLDTTTRVLHVVSQGRLWSE